MRCKVVCPVCGDVVSTYSINNFRHCGAQYDVKANLLAGEDAKYQKMVVKEGGAAPEKPTVVKPPVEKPVEKPAEKPVEKPAAAIIEEKPPEVVKPKPQKRIKKAQIEEKAAVVELEVTNFGFF